MPLFHVEEIDKTTRTMTVEAATEEEAIKKLNAGKAQFVGVRTEGYDLILQEVT